ncbi:hypothetical protein BCR41DRAFT_398955 [Lobosporangium transversale]|uniref:Uncharacterized protein n=1 Tax=Lobosporangium transversale TaxID=64571 RepID=A0A1Y2GF77_9FUNG|nr:hypothetical protein BCR41DRAFT_398955 [Lobosporangium transversale]ORZ09087.1 hypothetical protein BCR41DRAFT_398955 [Lobosporangium transversale]|eukprot:XP_021878714.1 hypothetical protein BCR41DRAFT_398955 [Lobosporangium transversale]
MNGLLNIILVIEQDDEKEEKKLHLRNVHIIHKAIPSTVLGPQAHIPNPANPVDQALDPPGTQQGSVAAAVSVAVAVPAVAVPAVAHPIETPDNVPITECSNETWMQVILHDNRLGHKSFGQTWIVYSTEMALRAELLDS